MHLLDSKDAKHPYKQRFIAGSSKCSTKPLSILLTKLLTHIKQGLKKYYETSYSRSGVNQMWILKNQKIIRTSSNLKITTISQASRPLISRPFTQPFITRNLKADLQLSFGTFLFTKNGNRRYKFLVSGREGPYFVKEHSDSKNKYTEDDNINMLNF